MNTITIGLVNRWALVGALLAPALIAVGEEIEWRITQDAVGVGGFVTIVIESRKVNLREITLTINGEDSLELAAVGPAIVSSDRTYLIAHAHLHRAETKEDGSLALSPLFREAGIATIRLHGGNLVEREVELRVLPLAEEAQAALDLMYPVVYPKAEDQDYRIRWPSLIMGLDDGNFERVLQVQYSEQELAAIRKHPDWDALVAAAYAEREFAIMRRDFVGAIESKAGPAAKLAAFERLRAASDATAGVSSTTPIVQLVKQRVADNFGSLRALHEATSATDDSH